MRETPWVFWASSAVITAVPTAPRAVNVLRSAWIPAPPLGSVPAMENATGGRWAHIQTPEPLATEPRSCCGAGGLDISGASPLGRSRKCVRAAPRHHGTHTGYRFIVTKTIPSLALSRSGSPGVFSARSLRRAGSSSTAPRRPEHPASGRQSNRESDRSHASGRDRRSGLLARLVTAPSVTGTFSYRAAGAPRHRRAVVAAAVVAAAVVAEPTGPSDGIWEPVRKHRRVSCSTGAVSTEPADRPVESPVVRT